MAAGDVGTDKWLLKHSASNSGWSGVRAPTRYPILMRRAISVPLALLVATVDTSRAGELPKKGDFWSRAAAHTFVRAGQTKRSRLLRGDRLWRDLDPERLRHAEAVCGIRAHTIGDVPLLDVQLGIAHRPRRVLEQQLLLGGGHPTE
jgi:hypothetical protein